MIERPIEFPPRVLARIGGVLYLIVIVIGLFGELVVRERIVAPGDAMATAANLRSMESLCGGWESRPRSCSCVVPWR
jgi:hypothetical protein